jgi:hypothetical protein
LNDLFTEDKNGNFKLDAKALESVTLSGNKDKTIAPVKVAKKPFISTLLQIGLVVSAVLLFPITLCAIVFVVVHEWAQKQKRADQLRAIAADIQKLQIIRDNKDKPKL